MKSSKLILAICLTTSVWALTAPPQPHRNPHDGVRHATRVSRPEAGPAAQAPHGMIVRGPGVHVVPGPRTQPQITPTESVPASYAGRHGRRHISARPALVRSLSVPEGKTVRKGERDPFVSPIMERAHNAAACVGSGRQCLIVGEITLHGIVRSSTGFIAVVANGEHTYFLRENDPLADGAVEKITHDAITMRQQSFDAVGHPLTREVTKRLGVVPAV